MSIGKNAIKRVENNGYSKVQSSAPDMENSHVIAKPDEQVVEMLVAPVEQAAEAKAEGKEPAKKPAAKKTAAKRPAAKKTPVQEGKDGFVRVSVGDNMPYYLL